MSKKKKNSRRNVYILLGLLALLLVAAAIKGSSSDPGEEVELAEVKKRTIVERVSASGKIYPEKEVKISSDVSGEIVELFVKEGDSVRQGQQLLRIDQETYASSVERGQASLDNARAQMAMSKASVKNSEAQKGQIEAQLINARQVYNRNKKLFDDGVIARQELETSETNLRALEANLRAADASIESGKEGVRGSQHTVRSMEASLKELRTNLNRTSIAAPTDGVISMLNVEQGERVVGTIQMTGTEIMRISNFSSIEVRVEVSETDILRVDVGDKAEVELDAYIDRVFTGVVTEIANSAANASANLSTEQVTNFIVKIRIDASSYADLVAKSSIFPLRPGMSASVDILTERAEDVLAVPIQSVTARELDPETDKRFSELEDDELIEVVFIAKQDTVAMAEVKTGIQDDDYIEILSGIEAGEQVVSGPYNVIAKELESGTEYQEKKDEKKKRRRRR